MLDKLPDWTYFELICQVLIFFGSFSNFVLQLLVTVWPTWVRLVPKDTSKFVHQVVSCSESLIMLLKPTCKRVPCLDYGAVVHAIFLDLTCAWMNFRRKKCRPMTKTLPKTHVSLILILRCFWGHKWIDFINKPLSVLVHFLTCSILLSVLILIWGCLIQ